MVEFENMEQREVLETPNLEESPNETLDRKLRAYFDGKIVRKDLTKSIKEGANVPVYVLEFLLGQYCSSDDQSVIDEGIHNVKKILADNFVRPDEAQKILSILRERGSYTVIDKLTVDGSAVKNPMNVLVPICMRMKDVFEATGGFKEEPKMVLYGGPMMGIAVPDLEQPILKNTNAILAFGEAEATPPEPTACIKCGKCIAHCPLSLMPCEMETAYKKGNIERLMHLKVNLCMECGCCSFICPAHRPLVQTNKLAKAQVMAYKNALKAKAEAEKQKEAAK